MNHPVRALALALLAALAAPLAAQSFPITAIDPSGEGEFPGSRGPDQMIVYTPAYDHPTTGTNPWGSEAVVSGGVVVSVGTNDSAIPEDGFVVSGHGVARDWINTNLAPGYPVIHDGTEVRIDDSPAGQFALLMWRLGDLRSRLDALAASGAPAETLGGLRAAIDDLENLIYLSPGVAMDQRAEEAREIESAIWDLELGQIPSPEGEVRGVWHRLSETTPGAITQLVEELEAAHVNAFFPETIYGSQAIFADETGLYPLFQHFEGHDALAQIIEECHARGIEVHAWVHCFFIGVQGNQDEPPLLAESHPQWLQSDREGRQVSIDEADYMFINPAQPEVRRALIDAYVSLVERYDLDGLQLDYIRYPNHQSWQRGWDYSEFTRTQVTRDLDFDPMEIAPDTHPEQWARWLAWREGVITSFVEEASGAIRAARPEIFLSADIFPGIEYAVEVKGQNWADWGQRGLVDAIIPMAYTTDPADVADAVSEMHRLLPEAGPFAIALGPFLGLSPRQLIDQIRAARGASSTGQILFCWDRLTPEARRALALGPWRSGGAPDWMEESL
ncbi:family 10 glycosylhydrolase [Candidatus Sumerlaeota bacterium]|nr:family 10 glycosylhydrolase [Candidatus Sumerlaeota bacterium]